MGTMWPDGRHDEDSYRAPIPPVNIERRIEEITPMHEILCQVFSHKKCDCGREDFKRKVRRLVKDILEYERNHQ